MIFLVATSVLVAHIGLGLLGSRNLSVLAFQVAGTAGTHYHMPGSKIGTYYILLDFLKSNFIWGKKNP